MAQWHIQTFFYIFFLQYIQTIIINPVRFILRTKTKLSRTF